jgi:hypothetical protein
MLIYRQGLLGKGSILARNLRFANTVFLSCRKFTWSFLHFQAEEEDEDDDLPRKDEL